MSDEAGPSLKDRAKDYLASMPENGDVPGWVWLALRDSDDPRFAATPAEDPKTEQELRAELQRLRATPLTDEAQELRELLAMLREHGVTRYHASAQGDVKIELGPGPGPKVAVPTPGCECPTCSSLWASPRWDSGPDSGEPWPGAFSQLAKAAKDAGWTQPATDQRPPSPPLPDEQPAVEIDYEALARQEQERRQKRDGAGS